MGADFSYAVKNIEIWASAFFKHNNSFIATVLSMYVDFWPNIYLIWYPFLKTWQHILPVDFVVGDKAEDGDGSCHCKFVKKLVSLILYIFSFQTNT